MVGRNWERVQVHLMARRLDLACRVTRCMTVCMKNSHPSPASMINDGDERWSAGIGCLLWNYLNQNVIIRNGTKEKDRRLFDMFRFRCPGSRPCALGISEKLRNKACSRPVAIWVRRWLPRGLGTGFGMAFRCLWMGIGICSGHQSYQSLGIWIGLMTDSCIRRLPSYDLIIHLDNTTTFKYGVRRDGDRVSMDITRRTS